MRSLKRALLNNLGQVPNSNYILPYSGAVMLVMQDCLCIL